MKILAVDIGTGTQDIYLYDTRLDLENGFKLVVPSPTMIVNHRLREATRNGDAVILTGVTMGGGPSQWAAEEHVRTGYRLYATPDAARSFNDDLDVIKDMGIHVISEDEVSGLPGSVKQLDLRDFNFSSIAQALSAFEVSLKDLAAVAVAVFDHGNAPPGYSDRQFRFDYLDERIRAKNSLSAFAYHADEIPSIMTRMQAVVRSAGQGSNNILQDVPLIVMDTAPAAILGATLDERVGECERQMIANVGNFHTLAFRLGPTGIEGVFEHHTGLLDLPKLDGLLCALADGSLKRKDVFDDHGHGALIYDPNPLPLPDEYHGGNQDLGVVVTGPRRNMMRQSRLHAYFAVPFGDMMIAGCFGLLSAVADLIPVLEEPIRESLRGAGGSGTPPWETG
jgi:uncharacterized protein (DUF1786 family)